MMLDFFGSWWASILLYGAIIHIAQDICSHRLDAECDITFALGVGALRKFIAICTVPLLPTRYILRSSYT